MNRKHILERMVLAKRFLPIFALAMALFLSGCGKSRATDSIPLRIQVSDTIENKNEVVLKIYEDLNRLHESGVPLRDYLLIVETTVKDNEKESTPDWFHCSESEIYNGRYLEPLELRYIDLNKKDTWKKYACHAYYSGLEPNPDKVKAFLLDEANKDVLSMFVGYWCPDFQTEEEMEQNADVAKLYGKYVIDHYGLEELLHCAARDHINEWLANLEIPYTFEDEYAEILDRFTYFENTEYHLIVKTDQNIEVYATPPEVDGNDVYLLRQFLAESYRMTDDLMRFIQQEAPDYYEQARDNLLSGHARIFFDYTMVSAVSGVTNPKSAEVRCNSYLVYAHEICHVILSSRKDTSRLWSEEGFANYAGFIRGEMPTAVELSVEKKKVESAMEHPGDYTQWYLDYLNNLQKILDTDPFVYGNVLKLVAQTELQLGEGSASYYSVYDSYAAAYSSINQGENSQLTYHTATFFVKYLIENYSLNNFFMYCFDDYSFEEAFGTSFSEALETWKNQFINEGHR